MRGVAAAIALVSVLGACSYEPELSKPFDPDSVAFRAEGPPKLTLFTMVSNSTGSGAHTSLMVNGSRRVIFDPAGSFRHEDIPTRNDVVHGVTPHIADIYTRYHARETYHVVVQEIDVSPEVAELALQKVLGYGRVPHSYCANSTSDILNEVPGFTHIRQTYFPNKLSEQFGKIPGVTTKRLFEYDDDDKSRVLKSYVPVKRVEKPLKS